MGDISENFNLSEFKCKDKCGEGYPHPKLLRKLEVLRRRCGDRRMTITSGRRCEKYNRKVGGVKNSQHCLPEDELTNAADVQVEGMEPWQVADKAEDLFTGIGRYPTFTHLDVRNSARKHRWRGKG